LREDDYGKLRCCEYYPVAVVERDEDGNIKEPEFEDGFDDSFLDFTLTYYGVNNDDPEKQYIHLPNIPELRKDQILRNLNKIREVVKSKVIL
jgi:hypothetical protein